MSITYRPAPVINKNFSPAPADPGLSTFLKTSAANAFYHMPTTALYRIHEQRLADTSSDNFFMNLIGGGKENKGRLLSADEANERFGVGEFLSFDEDINEYEAALLRDRKIAELERMRIIQQGSTTVGRKFAGLGAGLAATIVDPINLGTMFIPIVGQAKYARMTQQFGGSVTKARLARGAIEGFVGNAMVEPVVLIAASMDQAEYNYVDSAINLGFGAIAGSGLHAGLGKVGDLIQSRALNTQFARIKKTLDELDPDEADAMVRAAIADVMDDKPMASPSEVFEATLNEIEARAKFDVEEARAESLRELGFDKNAPKTFKFYSEDTGIHDPQPNEPWFHARAAGGNMVFSKNRPAFFSRSMTIPRKVASIKSLMHGIGDEPEIFVANLKMENPAGLLDLQNVINTMDRATLNQELIDNIPKENIRALGLDEGRLDIEVPLADTLFSPTVRKRLEEQGFDSYFGPLIGHTLYPVYDLDWHKATSQRDNVLAVVFNPEQIKSPGVRSKQLKGKGHIETWIRKVLNRGETPAGPGTSGNLAGPQLGGGRVGQFADDLPEIIDTIKDKFDQPVIEARTGGGVESLVLITEDFVIKLSHSSEMFKREMGTLTPDMLFAKKIGRTYVTIEESVVPLADAHNPFDKLNAMWQNKVRADLPSDADLHSNASQRGAMHNTLEKELELKRVELGLEQPRFHHFDAKSDNIGVTRDGDLVLHDRGGLPDDLRLREDFTKDILPNRGSDGIFFDTVNNLKRSVDDRVKHLRKSVIQNLIAKKRREFKKAQIAEARRQMKRMEDPTQLIKADDGPDQIAAAIKEQIQDFLPTRLKSLADEIANLPIKDSDGKPTFGPGIKYSEILDRVNAKTKSKLLDALNDGIKAKIIPEGPVEGAAGVSTVIEQFDEYFPIILKRFIGEEGGGADLQGAGVDLERRVRITEEGNIEIIPDREVSVDEAVNDFINNLTEEERRLVGPILDDLDRFDADELGINAAIDCIIRSMT